MVGYLIRRLILALFTVVAISMLSFAIIQLPPGDYVDAYIAQMSASGSAVSQQEAENLRIQYGLDQPIYVQYLKWMSLAVAGNFGMAMEYSMYSSADAKKYVSLAAALEDLLDVVVVEALAVHDDVYELVDLGGIQSRADSASGRSMSDRPWMTWRCRS